MCHSSRTWLTLGKPLFADVGPVRTFSYRSSEFSDAAFARALWKLLDHCPAGDLELSSDEEVDFDELAADYAEIEGLAGAGGVPMDQYLADQPGGATTYYAKTRPGYPRSAPAGIVRRSGTGVTAVDEAFTRNLRWEPTEFLRRAALGLDDTDTDTDTVEITEADAVDFALGVLAARLRSDWPERRRAAGWTSSA
jgi:hypothetical protein